MDHFHITIGKLGCPFIASIVFIGIFCEQGKGYHACAYTEGSRNLVLVALTSSKKLFQGMLIFIPGPLGPNPLRNLVVGMHMGKMATQIILSRLKIFAICLAHGASVSAIHSMYAISAAYLPHSRDREIVRSIQIAIARQRACE